VIIDKLKRLETNLVTLKKIKGTYCYEDFLSDKIDEWGLRYGFFETIQLIIDISSSIVAEKNLGMPKNYSESVILLISNKYLTNDLGEQIIKMIGLRNLIVQEYGIIDLKKLYEYLHHLKNIEDFVDEIKKLV